MISSAVLVALAIANPPIIPAPKSLSTEPGTMRLTSEYKVVAPDHYLPVAEAFIDDLESTTGLRLEITDETSFIPSITFTPSKLSRDQYAISTAEDRIRVVAGGKNSLAHGASTLLQLIDKKRFLPLVRIDDRPQSGFRSLMVDVARNYHSIDVLKKLVQACRIGKINYLQLHLTDDQNWMFPSDSLGDMTRFNSHGKPHYTKNELRELDSYAAARGVTIIPEIDVPGHSSLLVKSDPKTFQFQNTNLGGCINFASPEVRARVKTLINEAIDLFPNSKYIHFGGDEAWYSGAEKDPQMAEAMKEFGTMHEVFRDFLGDMARHILSRNRTPISWEGYGGSRNSKVKLPEELIIINWDGHHDPRAMIEDGFKVINACWDPMYIVDHYPRDNFTYAAPARIYRFDEHRFQTFFNGKFASKPVTIEPSPLLVGSMMCWWEGREENAVRMVAERAIVYGARVWAGERENNWNGFRKRYEALSSLLERLIGPTPAVVANSPVHRSLTTGARVTTDADLFPSHLPSIVVDGRFENRLNYWMAYPLPATLTIDLGSSKELSELRVFCMWDGGASSRYRVFLSGDGSEWKEVVDFSSNKEPATADGYRHEIEKQNARYIRFEALGSSKVPGTFARVVEIQAF